jgi:hypothetical protein
MFVILATLFAAALTSLPSAAPSPRAADGGTCFICKKTSTKQCADAVFCRSLSGLDTPQDRRQCRAIGCDIGGTATCRIRESELVCAPPSP